MPLGRETAFPSEYAPQTLFAIARAESRAALGLRDAVPFRGVDIWNAWELTWLGAGGLPQVATAGIVVPADSPNIIESKSLKLYLNSFAMSEFGSAAALQSVIEKDLGKCAGCDVAVRVTPIAASEARSVARLAGTLLDTLDVGCSDWEVNADLLSADAGTIVTEDVHTHLLRSLCPVTSQPDTGSLQISYSGPRIDHAGLLRYVVSFREHQDFHESCIERMFMDLMTKCAPRELSLHARYQRRGGIDINPYRSTSGRLPRNLRLWRQ
ncbi:MAG: NADPH-dependent 7-cyano-7-deazaguanine reductase QueF [Gammaproteobacteria bacterium]|nr:NADPH-dependent 7-cyano-7-deazaguanine reductase QueF [Gammaproteobacteria bacterium]